MKRLTWPLVLLFFALGACSASPPPPVTANYRSASIKYNGAAFAGYGVSVSPFGSVSARVSGTTSLAMTAYGKGQSFQVNVDGVRAGTGRLKDCGCLTTVTVTRGLNSGSHLVTVTNLAPRRLVFTRWTIDGGGSFRRAAVRVTSVRGAFGPNGSTSFYVRQASSIAIDHPPTNATVRISIDGRPEAYPIQMHAGSSAAPSASTTYDRTWIAWGLAPGLTNVTLTVVTGHLTILGMTLMQFPGVGVPELVPDDVAARSPKLAVFGDSIGDGQRSLGFAKDSDGFASDLTSLRGWRLLDLSKDGASGSCYGVREAPAVVAAHPDAVIVVFGANDMAAGPDFEGCDPDAATYGREMQAMLTTLKTGLPNAVIFVQAILPVTTIPERVRSTWNAALRAAADAADVRFIDPSTAVNPKIDYDDSVHPNDRGHRKIAEYWNGILPSL